MNFFILGGFLRVDFPPPGKSTLWTNTGQENFERHWSILISGGNSYGPIIGPYRFLGKFGCTNGPQSSSKVPPYTGIGRWMALPSPLKSYRSPNITLGTFSHKNAEKKSGEEIPEKIRRSKKKNPQKICFAKIRP